MLSNSSKLEDKRLLKTKREFAVMGAELGKLLAHRDNLLIDLKHAQTLEYNLLSDITLNFQVVLTDMKGPLKLLFSYPDDSA